MCGARELFIDRHDKIEGDFLWNAMSLQNLLYSFKNFFDEVVVIPFNSNVTFKNCTLVLECYKDVLINIDLK